MTRKVTRNYSLSVVAAVLAVLVPAVLGTRSAQAQDYAYRVLYSFTGADGAYPQAGLVLDAQGNLYGTTANGGDLACLAPHGCGTVFKVDTAGKETVLYSFTGGADAVHPQAGLVLDAQGNLYGTTVGGGAYGVGTVFKVDPSGAETVLHSFSGSPDGAYPLAGLVLDAQGNLYGTTYRGGNNAYSYGYGTVFKVDTTGNVTVLHAFSNSPDGVYPQAGLVLDAQGNLYGTTSAGGAQYNQGTVFKVDTAGNETVLYSFGRLPDGESPFAGLVMDSSGYLYGTTFFGGMWNRGTMFWVDKLGREEVFKELGGKYGAYPEAGLVLDARFGVLYGTTLMGGAYSKGAVFAADTDGAEVVLHSFGGKVGDGANPHAGLALDAHENLYGTTRAGGAYGYGTVFKLTPATKTTLTTSPDPSVYGQVVTFTAAVVSNMGLGVPPDGETVSFMRGTTVLGTGSLSGGSATFTTSKLKVGTLLIKAVYGGDSNFGGSTSKAVSQAVIPATTTTALVSSLNPSSFGQAVTFTASVTPQFSSKVTGTLTFYDGATALTTKYLSGGVAKFTTKTLASGTHIITATYNGNINFIGSSASLTQTVN
jgi:uncharacterized repeat protein (TIGR03803 family)